jgi:hypothetical protein
MYRPAKFALIVAIGLAAGSVSALAVGPGSPGTRPAVDANVEPASFFGLPFPYGYRWHRHPECMKTEEYRDFWGTVYSRRVWVCDGPPPPPRWW